RVEHYYVHLPKQILSVPFRWKFKDPLAKEEESDLPDGLLKVLWCQGITYRVLREAVPVIEISLGDGSLIRSNGVLNSYFTHHKPKLQAEEVKDLTYHLNSLPPDVPGQAYSLCAAVNRASRILACYNQAKLSLKRPATPSCLQEDKHFSNSTASEQNPSSAKLVEQHVNVPQAAESLSDVVAAELEKIKRFNFLLENSHLLSSESKQGNPKESPEITPDPEHEDYVAEALQRTSKAIQDIDALISAATLT
uniref:C5orf34-like domain-containing protein n=1 Tax=Kryptolebias marmoratus TaxID=37003 RepID=A0A3Q2ZII5_KRYMA